MSDRAFKSSIPFHRLLLIRHGQVGSHRGDVPLTDSAVESAFEVGSRLAGEVRGELRVLCGGSLRTVQTARAISAGARSNGSVASDAKVAHALRNPDIYLGGERVDMVSTTADFANQVGSMDESAVESVPFFSGFVRATDRIGYWLQHRNPPGEDGSTVALRVQAFAASFRDLGSKGPNLTVAVTHSPLLRACAIMTTREDPGEPDWLSGLEVRIPLDRSFELSWSSWSAWAVPRSPSSD